MRKFEIVERYKLFKDPKVEIPQRATKKSSGYDFVSLNHVVIQPGKSFIFDTGIKVCMEDDEELEIIPRSSIGFKKELVLLNTVGKIDSDYYNNPKNEGHIMIGYKNTGTEPQEISIGERIAQGTFRKYLITDDDAAVGDRVGGIGSTNQ
jgi:dUTP pyrophosphatase